METTTHNPLGVDILADGIDRWLEDTHKRELLGGAFRYFTATGDVVVPYNPFARQSEFLENQNKYNLFGGAAGPGKTLTLLMDAVRTCHMRQDDEARLIHTLCLRRTVPQLESSFLREFRAHVPRELYESYNDQKKLVRWRNGSTLRFGSMQYEKDVWDYQGTQYAAVEWDELCQFLLSQWQVLSTWNRCPIRSIRTHMNGAANPIGVGALWVKAFFVDKKPAPGMEDPWKYKPERYSFFPASITDNPIYANDPEYLETLNDLPKVLRDAMLLGLWTLAVGAYFDILDRATMSFRREEVQIEPWWPRWISMDWGFEHPSSVLFWTVNPQGVVLITKQIHLRDERAGVVRHRLPNHMDPGELGDLILKEAEEDGQIPRYSNFYLSPDAFAKRTKADTIAQQITRRLRGKLPAPEPADDARVDGWQLMYSYLKHGGLLIADDCYTLWDTLPVLVRDEKKPEDIEKMDGIDDSADSARYGLKSRFGAKPPPRGVQIAQQAAKALEETSGNMSLAMIAKRRAEVENQPRPRKILTRRPPLREWRRRN